MPKKKAPKDTPALAYIRETYGVPAYVGRRVTAIGMPGVIVGAKRGYLIVLLDNGLECSYHPTWKVDYDPTEQAEPEAALEPVAVPSEAL